MWDIYLKNEPGIFVYVFSFSALQFNYLAGLRIVNVYDKIIRHYNFSSIYIRAFNSIHKLLESPE